MRNGWRRPRAGAEELATSAIANELAGSDGGAAAANGAGADTSAAGVVRAADGFARAAFFDLDKTLMAGSSGVFFARAAYESGMISRARLARDVYENFRFRLRGSTDDRADAVRERVG